MRMKRVVQTLCLLVAMLASAAHATTYYVSQSTGSDSNSGLTPALAIKTITQANILANTTMVGGDTILFKRNDVWRDGPFKCGTPVNATSSTTLANTPQTCSGTSEATRVYVGAYGDGYPPLFDGADIFTATWTNTVSCVYTAPLGGNPLPSKMYVDPVQSWRQGQALPIQVYPAPNVVDTAYNSATTYKYLDASGTYMHGETPTTGVVTSNAVAWGVIQPGFDTTSADGPTNVQNVPNSFYTDGTTVWMHLTDCSSPASHTIEVTHRDYGIIVYGNYVTVSGISVARVSKRGIAVVGYSDSTQGGSYFTGEYDIIDGNYVWNAGDFVLDAFPTQGGNTDLECAVCVQTGREANAHPQRGNIVRNNYIGTFDLAYGSRQRDQEAGIMMAGQDGGGLANNDEMVTNFIATLNAYGAVYGATNISVPSRISGGRIANNVFTQNQGNLFVNYVAGVLVEKNKIYRSSGQGVQSGGNGLSTASVPNIYRYNLIYHLDASYSGQQYNGFDCNGTAPGNYYYQNTVVDTNSDSITHEIGCQGSTMKNNIFDQNHPAYPAFASINNSYLMYFQPGSHTGAEVASNNLWVPGTNSVAAKQGSGGTSYSCANYLTFWPDTNSVCATSAGYVNYAQEDFRLTSASPAYQTGDAGQNMGAFDGTANQLDLSKVGPQIAAAPPASTVTRFFGQFSGRFN